MRQVRFRRKLDDKRIRLLKKRNTDKLNEKLVSLLSYSVQYVSKQTKRGSVIILREIQTAQDIKILNYYSSS